MKSVITNLPEPLKRPIMGAFDSAPSQPYSPRNKAFLDKRRRKIVEMRELGFNFREIGDMLGLGRSYTQMIYVDAVRRMLLFDEVFGFLSGRARNCLTREGLKTKEEVIEAIKSGALHPKRQGNYGAKTHKEVCRWAGVSLCDLRKSKTDHVSRGASHWAVTRVGNYRSRPVEFA